jgi:DNA repair protein RecO (recombination protein O)
MIQTTSGIVFRTTRYGDSSLISSIYTRHFGIQNYLVKGVRKSFGKSEGKAACFQPGAILELVVYHQDTKNLQYIREVNWGFLYTTIYGEVIKNTVALFMVEILQHCIRQPEPNSVLYEFIEKSLRQLDQATPKITANFPLFFALRLSSMLGFQLQGKYSDETSVLDLQEGQFVTNVPAHPYFLEGEASDITSRLQSITDLDQLEKITVPRTLRKELLASYLQFYGWHVPDFGNLRSWQVIQEILH